MKMEEFDYSGCVLYENVVHGKCGAWKIPKKNVKGLFRLNDCNKDVHNHLCNIKIRKRHDRMDD